MAIPLTHRSARDAILSFICPSPSPCSAAPPSVRSALSETRGAVFIRAEMSVGPLRVRVLPAVTRWLAQTVIYFARAYDVPFLGDSCALRFAELSNQVRPFSFASERDVITSGDELGPLDGSMILDKKWEVLRTKSCWLGPARRKIWNAR